KDLPVNGDLTTQGFATDYGASYPGEDMAEYASALLVPEDFGEIPPCARIRNAPTPFPAELAIAFAKIKFVQSLGLVPDRSIDGCVGNPSLEGPEGLHLGDALSLEANLKGGWLDADGAHFLAVAADAGPYRSLLRVKAPNDHALGMHRLASIAFPTLNMPNNALYLSHDDYDRTRASSGGLVLVTSASPWRVEGAIFFLTLQNARGMITDEFPISTFRVSTP
ncbi:MAG TPA: hypothetical protein VNN80_06270, partial [Polyangiaceae bacterium]|nr:hypothetical protein [Polyangiaceae bacterium]